MLPALRARSAAPPADMTAGSAACQTQSLAFLRPTPLLILPPPAIAITARPLRALTFLASKVAISSRRGAKIRKMACPRRPQDGPRGARRPKIALRCPKRAPRGLQDVPRRLQDAPGGLRDLSRRPPGGPKSLIFLRFLYIFEICAQKAPRGLRKPPGGRRDAPRTPQGGPRTPPRRPKIPPGGPQDLPKRLPTRHKTAPRAPGPTQEPPKGAPGRPKTAARRPGMAPGGIRRPEIAPR